MRYILCFIFMLPVYILQAQGLQNNKLPLDTLSSVLPNVKILSDSFWIPQLNRYRSIRVYLPNDYEKAITKRYPVIYMMDGQNLFDKQTSFAGEWGIDETMNKLEKKGEPSCIVVGIDHGGIDRINELSPFVNSKYGGGEGKLFALFIVKILKPFIDSVFRTSPDRLHTAIGGSSLGANLSLYAMVAYPDIFSKAALFSPAFWFSDSLYEFIKLAEEFNESRFYFTAGYNESNTMASDVMTMDSLIVAKGCKPDLHYARIIHDGEHREWFWRREFANAYFWLFMDINNPELVNLVSRMQRATRITPNPASAFFEVRCFPMKSLQVLNNKGITIIEQSVNGVYVKVDVTKLENGIYTLVINLSAGGSFTKKLEVEHH